MPEDAFIDFRERKEERERETEMERNTSVGCLLYMPQLGIEPAAEVCALTGDLTHDFSVHGTTLHPTETHWSGQCSVNIF